MYLIRIKRMVLNGFLISSIIYFLKNFTFFLPYPLDLAFLSVELSKSKKNDLQESWIFLAYPWNVRDESSITTLYSLKSTNGHHFFRNPMVICKESMKIRKKFFHQFQKFIFISKQNFSCHY